MRGAKIALSIFNIHKLPPQRKSKFRVYALLNTLTTLLVFHMSITIFFARAIYRKSVQMREYHEERRWKLFTAKVLREGNIKKEREREKERERVERKSRHTHNRQRRWKKKENELRKEFSFTLKKKTSSVTGSCWSTWMKKRSCDNREKGVNVHNQLLFATFFISSLRSFCEWKVIKFQLKQNEIVEGK